MSEAMSAPNIQSESQGSTEEQGESTSLREAFEDASKGFEFEDKSPEREEPEAKSEKIEPEAKVARQEESKEKEAIATPESKPDYEKSYKEIQATYTKDRQEASRIQKEYTDKLAAYESKVKLYDQFDHIVKNNPDAYKALERAVKGETNVDPALAADPLYQYMVNQQKQLQQELGPLKQFYQATQSEKQQAAFKAQETAVDQALEKAETAAKEQYKTMFGSEMPQEDFAKVYKTFLDTQAQPTPELTRAVVRDLYFDKHIESERQKALTQNMAKRGISSRVSTASSSKAPSKAEVRDLRSAFESAWDTN